MSTESSFSQWKRTHNLGQLNAGLDGETVVLNGWVHRRRDHGQVVFVDLRDSHGKAQVVFDPAFAAEPMEIGNHLRNEYVLAVRGKVVRRPDGMVNKDLASGEIEVHVQAASVLNSSQPLPFQINEMSEASETLRLKYRYLDLRRDELRNRIMARVKLVRYMREALEKEGFLDLETPLLYKSTPEGAREFLVPSRIHAGQFYALPQSPQIFKQILMVSGFERYYQVVKCFRDEDLRADRQPEFTQIDCELSFVDREDVMDVFERVTASAAGKLLGQEFQTPFPRMTYAEAMADYGVDKPDTRFEMKLVDLSETVAGCDFRVFSEALSMGGIVNAIVVKGKADGLSRKDLDRYGDYVKQFGSKGLAWGKKGAGSGVSSLQSPIAKFFSDEVIDAIAAKTGLAEGDVILFGAGSYDVVKASLGNLRVQLANDIGLIDPNLFNFLWVVDFPMFEMDAASGRLVACHHPFTAPLGEDVALLGSEPDKARAAAYDLVLNGNEVAGGSVRIHQESVQRTVFEAMKLSEEEAKEKFGFLLEALSYGAPPHGGIAFGLDRLVMVLGGMDSIKETIPFPKTNKAACLMTESPAPVTSEELRDLHIRVHSLES